MNISTASALIGQHLEQGLINRATAAQAQDAIRASHYYGNRLTGDDRRRLLSLRLGIVEQPRVVTPVVRPFPPATFEGIDADGFARYSGVVL